MKKVINKTIARVERLLKAGKKAQAERMLDYLRRLSERAEKRKNWADVIRLARARLKILATMPPDEYQAPEDDCYWDIVNAQRKMGYRFKALETLDVFRRKLYSDDYTSWEEKIAYIQAHQAELYAELGRIGRALSLNHQAILALQVQRPDSRALGECLNLQGQLHLQRGRAGSKKDLQQACELLREAATYYYREDDGGAVEHIIGAQNLGEACRRLKKLKEATEQYQHAYEVCGQKYGPTSEQAANAMGDLAVVAIECKRYTEARQWLQQGISIMDKLEQVPPRAALLAQLQNLAYVETMRHRFQAAICAGRNLLAVAAIDLSPDDPPLATYLHNHAGVLALAGDKAEAESMYLLALQVYEKNEPANHSGRKRAERELQSLKVGRFRKSMKSFFYAGPVRTWTLGLVDEDEGENER